MDNVFDTIPASSQPVTVPSSAPSGSSDNVFDQIKPVATKTDNTTKVAVLDGVRAAAKAAHDQLGSGGLDRIDSGVRAIANGIPFMDRIAAGMGALTGIGGTQGDYAGNLAAERAKDTQFSQEHPGAAITGQLLGGAMLPVGAIAAANPATLAGKMAVGALTGAGIGGVYGASDSPDLTNISETAKSTAKGAGTGLVIGGAIPAIGAGIGRLVSPPSAVETVANRINITPDVAQKAQALIDDANKSGIKLTLQEAIDKASGGKTALSDLTRVVSNTQEGRPIMDAFYNQRPQQIQNAGGAMLDSVAPKPMYAPKAGLDVQEGAGNIIKGVNRAINEVEGPYYRLSDNIVVPDDAINGLKADKRAGAAFEWARNKVLSDKVASAPFTNKAPELPAPGSRISAADYAKLQNTGTGSGVPNTIEFLGEVRKTLADTVENLQGQGLHGQARNYKPALQALDDILKSSSKDYATALEKGASLRQNILNPLENSTIGKVAATPDIGAQAAAVFKPAPIYSDATDAGRLAASLSDKNPKAAEALLRAHLQSAFNESTQNLQGGPNVMGAANFAAKIAGNGEQANVIESYMRSLPNGDMKWQGLRRFLDIAEATGMKPAMGSNTAYDTKAINDLAGNGPVSIARDVAKSAGTMLTQVPRRLSDWYVKLSMGKNIEQIAKIMTDPRGGKILERLSQLPANDPTAKMLAYRLTFLGNAGASYARKQNQN